MPELVLIISQDGSQVEAEAHGFIGGECQSFLTKILGGLGTVEKEKKKAEFYMEKEQTPPIYEG